MPKAEIRGSRIRLRQVTPRKGCRFRTHVLAGRKGHAYRIAMKCPYEPWKTQSYTVPIEDVRAMRPSTMRLLGKIGRTKEALKLAGVA